MTGSNSPLYFHYKLTLHSPAIVSMLAGDPNSIVTAPFIPGSAIRGAMAARLLSAGVKDDSEEFRTLILSGDIYYLHAYPESGGSRALPVPVSWKAKKEAPDYAYDLAEFGGSEWPEEALASVSAPFVSSSGSRREKVLPRRNARLHQQRDRIKGRPWKGHDEQSYGAIFAYEYLEAGQIFRGAIQIVQGEASRAERIKALLAQSIFIGRSRRAGYGGEAALEFIGNASRHEYDNISDWLSNNVQAGECFRLILTSSYIGRHPGTGQVDPAALELELSNLLRGAASVERRRWTYTTVGGFNQKWRLELPQALAIAAGSVLVLKAEQAIPIANLRDIEHAGLGERRSEGFGRLVFLKHGEDRVAFPLNDPEPESETAEPTGTASLTEKDKEQLDFIEARIVLAAARAELDRVATLDIASGARKAPTTALLGRLRSLFRNVMNEMTARHALSTLVVWCSDDEFNPDILKRPARAKLDHCEILKTTLRQWLQMLAQASEGQARWKILVEASGTPSSLTGLAARNHLGKREAAEAILYAHVHELSVYLIDAVLASLARQSRKRESSQ